MMNVEGRLNHADSRMLAIARNVHTFQDFPKMLAVRNDLPTYRAIVKEAVEQRSATTDSVLQSSWSELAADGRSRVHFVAAVNKLTEEALSGGHVSPSDITRVQRLLRLIEAQNQRWPSIANRLNHRFRNC